MSIDLKGVTFSILLAALGVALVLVGAAEKLTLIGSEIQVRDPAFRVVLVVLGIILLLGASAFQITELRRTPSKSAESEPPAPAAPPATAGDLPAAAGESFFRTLDDSQIGSFPACVEGGIRLQILARTVVNLIGQYSHVFASLAQKGCDIQILLVDPSSESSRYLYGSNHALYLRNAKTALTRLAELQQQYSESIHVRFFPNVPTVSIMNVERRDAAESFVQVQMYFIQGAIGRDRPIFRITRADPWYRVFRDEFESIWKRFPDADVAAYAANL